MSGDKRFCPVANPRQSSADQRAPDRAPDSEFLSGASLSGGGERSVGLRVRERHAPDICPVLGTFVR